MDRFLYKSKVMGLGLAIFLLAANIEMLRACPSGCDCGKYGNSPFVNCEGRNLLEFPGNINPNAEILRFRQNMISRLPTNFQNLVPNVTTLSIEKNRIDSLPDGIFSNLRKLREVFISYNKIKSIGKRLFANSASGPGTEVKFHIQGNQLEFIADDVFKGCSAKFKVLWNSNSIKAIRLGIFAGAEGIYYLNLDNNRITSLPSGVFKDLSKMYYLGLANNSLSKITTGAFQGLHRLETLTLQRNRISTLAPEIFKDLVLVKEINLESNLFTEVPADAIRVLPNFSRVKLKNNPIKCTCELIRQLSDTAVKSKITDLKQTQCTNLNKTVEEAMSDVNCVTEAAPTTPTTVTTEAAIVATSKNVANAVLDSTSGKTDVDDGYNVYTMKSPEDDSSKRRTPLPLIIGVAIGSFIIVVVIILFIYLYRRPIARRAVSTMSLPRKKHRHESKTSVSYQRPPPNDYANDYNI